jgi:long-chain acyl-CoA synthetase
VAWILGDSQAVAIIVESPDHAAVVEEVRDQTPDLRHVWVIENSDLEGLLATGRDADPQARQDSHGGLAASSMASIIYTSGTTGRPKGCVLTHANLLFGSRTAVATLPALFHEHTSALLFLPLAHVLAREIQVACVEAAVPIGHCPNTHTLQADLVTFRPTLLLAVPYVFERLYSLANQRAVDEGKGRIFAAATETAISASLARDGGRAGPLLAVRRAMFDMVVYRKLRAALGGNVQWVISGGAPLGRRLGHFFRGAGIPVLEGWGLTESTAAAAVNRPDAVKIGTVGPPLAGVTVGVADDGELLVRGANVFQRYWGDPEGTAAALDADGWLHTGDLGDIDDAGFVTIRGRKKEILVTSGGKNVSPAQLEDRLRGHPLIAHCIVVGDRRPYVGALVTLDEEALASWKSKVGKDLSLQRAQLRDDPELLAEIQVAVDEANRSVSRAESIRRFRVLDADFTEDGGQLTPTLKLRRDVVLREFDGDVEALYDRSDRARASGSTGSSGMSGTET